uniref:PDZ domain-containing protein n=1 Tax=Physcomitrium patens TaxID=3218 RepID=A0A7I4AVI7_PHYPA
MIRIRAMATLSRISLAVPLGGGGLRQNGDALRMASLVVPVSGNMVQSLARVRLFSQFRGTQLGNVKRVAPELKRGTNFEGSIRRSHGRAVAYTGEESMRETQGLESLKASQIKKVLDAGKVDYRDCLERNELVERLKDTKNFITPAAQQLLQRILCGEDDEELSASLLQEVPNLVEGWWLEAERNTVKVFQECSPSVANISTSTTATIGMSMNPVEIPRGTGSAFVWDAEGHVVTNYHVVMNGNKAKITLSDASTWEGTVVGVAKNKDLAVLKIAAPASRLRPIVVGSSQALQVGQHVLAIGNPFGLDRTLTSGIISGVGRDIRSIGGAMIRGVVQTDASINPGNSGGPLLDSQGRLIGVNTAIYSPSGASAGIGFAIPVDTVRRVVNELIRKGKVSRPGLGIMCASDSQAKQLGVNGVLVFGLSENGAAAKAGLLPTKRDLFGRIELGDIIVAINGQVTVKRGTMVRDVYITLQEIDE